jgi:hypothetical protein
MMINRSPNAYRDCIEAFDRALETPKGIKIPCVSRGHAIRLRQRFNYCRYLDRDRSKDIYQPGDPMYGLSVYDTLELRIPKKGAPDAATLYIEPRLVENLNIQEID